MSTDALSEVLRAVRLRGAVFFDVHATAPWVASAPPAKELAPHVKLGTEHLIEYHVIISGRCWATIAGGEPEPFGLAHHHGGLGRGFRPQPVVDRIDDEPRARPAGGPAGGPPGGSLGPPSRSPSRRHSQSLRREPIVRITIPKKSRTTRII